MEPEHPYQDIELRILLKRIAGRDKPAFRALYQAIYPALARHLLRLTGNIADVEELINDVMWVVWEKASQFRGDSQVKTWVLGIATLKSYRWRHLQPPRSDAVDELELHVDVEMAEEESVASTIDTLSPEQRETFRLAFYFGYSCEEIAALMNCPVGTVKTRLFHARKQLQSHFVSEVKHVRTH